jgi:ADP-ribosylglycohydrolase
MTVSNVITMDRLLDRQKGTIYGQAIGDALGLGTEGMTDEDMAWKYPNGITHYSEILAHPDFSVADLHRPCMTA